MGGASRYTYVAQERGDRARPGRLHPRYSGLTLLAEKLTRIVESDRLPRGDRVLDYGCGNRPYEALFRRKFNQYLAADFPGNKAADLTIGPRGELPLGHGTVDCVLSTQVLEHVEDPRAYLAEAYRVLKPDGALILSTHGMWRYHPDPTDYWRWTVDGLQVEVYQAGFDISWIQSVFGLASCGLQFWQDGTADAVPRSLRPLYVWGIQFAISLIERRRLGALSSDACLYVVLAGKRTHRDLSMAELDTHRLNLAKDDVRALIPRNESLILVDDGEWSDHLGHDRHTIPFLEREGEYWGIPPDDRTAIREFERLRRAGAGFIVFARPAFWWLDYYAAFQRHLRANFAAVVENDRLVIFDVRGRRRAAWE